MEEKKDNLITYNENNLINNAFIKDNFLSYLIKKTERLCTAIYMISNFFDTEEPLKWELRKNATKLLRNIMSFNNTSLSHREAIVLKVHNDFMEMSALFNLAYNSGFISQMNHGIVFKELNNLANSILEYHNNQISSNKTLFDQNYFEVQKDTNSKTDIWDKVLSDSYTPKSLKDIKDNIKDNKIVFKGHKKDLDSFFKKHIDNSKIEIQNNSEKENRKLKILELIKNSGSINIKDISNHFKDVGDKTIQRELQKMIENGQIRKEGERRWTKYFI